MSGCVLVPHQTKAGSIQPCGFCLYKHQTNVICNHSLGIWDTDLASVHHLGKNFIKLASNLSQNLWQWSYSLSQQDQQVILSSDAKSDGKVRFAGTALEESRTKNCRMFINVSEEKSKYCSQGNWRARHIIRQSTGLMLRNFHHVVFSWHENEHSLLYLKNSNQSALSLLLSLLCPCSYFLHLIHICCFVLF